MERAIVLAAQQSLTLDGGIDWDAVSSSVRGVLGGGENLNAEMSPDDCKRVWRRLAYGSAEAESDNEDDYFLQPYRAVRRHHLTQDINVFDSVGEKCKGDVKKSGAGSLCKISSKSEYALQKVQVTVYQDDDTLVSVMRPMVTSNHHLIYPPSYSAKRRARAGVAASAFFAGSAKKTQS